MSVTGMARRRAVSPMFGRGAMTTLDASHLADLPRVPG